MSAAIALSITDQVRAVIAAQCGRDVDDVAVAHALDRDLGADTLDRIEIALTLERRFGIMIDDASVSEWRTVGDVVATLAPPTMERAVA